MKRGILVKITAIILSVIILLSGLYFLLGGREFRREVVGFLDQFLPDYIYVTDIQRNWTTPDEENALMEAERLPLNVLLNTTRYSGGNETAKGTQMKMHYIDEKVVEDGKEYVRIMRSTLNSGRHSFEYKASCKMFDIVNISISPRNEPGYYKIKITTEPAVNRLDSFWAPETPFTGIWDLSPPSPYHGKDTFVYQDGSLDPPESGMSTFSFYEAYFITMLVEIGSSNRLEDTGSGNGVYQYIVLNEEMEPIFIMSSMWRWVV